MDDKSGIAIRAMLRIGTWKLEVKTGVYMLDKVTCEVLQLPYDTKLVRGQDTPFERPSATEKSIAKGVNELIKSGTPYDDELEFKTLKGDLIWLHVIATRKLENGKCTEIFGIVQDITKSKKSQETFYKQNQLLNLAEEKAKLGHWNWNTKTNTFVCSENMARMIDVPSNIPIPMGTLLSKVNTEDKEYVEKQLALNLKNKFFNNFTHRMPLLDGTIRMIQVSGDIHLDDNGEIINVIGICQDITSYKDIESELVRKNELLSFAEQKALLGHWDLNAVTNEVFWSANLYYLFKQEQNSKLEFNTYIGYVHPEDQAIVTEHFAKARENRRFDKIIHRILLKDGTIKWILLMVEVIVNEQDEITKLVGTCQDVTEQQLQEAKFKGLVDSAPSATFIIGTGGIVQMINKEATKLFGYATQEIIGKPIEKLIPPRFNEKGAIQKDQFLTNMKAVTIDLGEDFYMIHKSGREIPVIATLGPLQTDEGLIISMAVRDITSDKIAEAKILKSNKALEILTKELTAQNHQLADFTQITSHNLRAPVSNLNSLVDLYKLMEDEAERDELFKKFETVISHLTLTLNTLIEALTAKSHTSLERSNLSFSETLTKTKEIFTAEIERTQAIIKSDFSEVDVVWYHKIYLESFFQNLIGNALKYKSDNRIPEITVSSKITDGKVTLSFRDNGLGIDLDKHGHKIFGLNKVFHNHPEAKGIGLFMTKTQIEAMGGTITVTSQVNLGTTFTIHFI